MKTLVLAILLVFTPLLAEETAEKFPIEMELLADAPKQTAPAEKKEETPPPEPAAQDTPVDVHKATESYETAFIKTIVVLVGLLVLVVLTIWMFRKISHGRFRGMNVLKSVKILEKRPLSPKSMLYLVEVGGKQVLLAESQLEVRNVATLDYLGTDNDL